MTGSCGGAGGERRGGGEDGAEAEERSDVMR